MGGQDFLVVAAGRAYIDVVSPVLPAFLERFGIACEGSIYPGVERLQEIIGHLEKPEWIPGGPGANSLTGLASLGASVGFFGKVCDDQAGRIFREAFDRSGVSFCCDPVCKTGSLSGCCVVVLTPDGSRSFALDRGCVDAFGASDFDGFDFTRAKVFMVEAHQMESAAGPVLLDAMERARAVGCRVVLTLQQTFTWAHVPDLARRMIDLSDVVLGNEVEVHALCETVPFETWREGTLCVTTNGDEGVVARWGRMCVHQPAVKGGEVVSSLGAGDQFAAGFLYGYAMGWDCKKSLALGVHTARAILEEKGARPTVSFAPLLNKI